MSYLDLAPAIAAIRARPEEFDFSHDTLHHRRSRHSFRFVTDDEVRIDAVCDCSLLRASPEQTRALRAAYQEWRASYWRSVEINREFSSHFAPPSLWRRLAARLLEYLLSRPSSPAQRASGARSQDKALAA